MISENLIKNTNIDSDLVSSITEMTRDAIIVITYDHKIVIFNSHAENLFGFSAKEVLDKDLDIILPKNQHGIHKQKAQMFADDRCIGSCVESTQRLGLDLKGVRKNGSIFYANITISKISFHDQIFMIAIIHDITKERLVYKELTQKQKELDEYRRKTKSELLKLFTEEIDGSPELESIASCN